MKKQKEGICILLKSLHELISHHSCKNNDQHFSKTSLQKWELPIYIKKSKNCSLSYIQLYKNKIAPILHMQ